MANQTYDLPLNLGDLMGAYDEAHWQTQVCEIKAGIGVLQRGTILASGTAGDIGKLVPLSAGTEAQTCRRGGPRFRSAGACGQVGGRA